MVNNKKSRERVKEFGEVFTPRNLVDDMHRMISHDRWSDPEMIYLEPACGDGNFIVRAILKKIKHGLGIIQAVNTVFGMDIQRDNVIECRKRVYDMLHKSLRTRKKKELLVKILKNNIFRVDDSIEYIESGKWEAKKFYNFDPSGEGKVVR